MIDTWISAASELATECGYGEIRDEMLPDHIVCATNSEVVRTKCLEVGDKLTLQQTSQEHTMATQTNGWPNLCYKSYRSVTKHPLQKNNFNKYSKSTTASPATTTKRGHSNKFFNCGRNRHPMREYPVRDAKCYNCSRMGHFSKLCLSKNKKGYTVDTTYVNDFVMTINVCHILRHWV